MARRKKPANETNEQATERLLFEMISNHADRSEKTAWKRKLNNLESLIDDLKPIEEKILNIISNEKIPILDAIHVLRSEMVKGCIHPYEHLVQKDGYVECKFCNKRIQVNNG